MSNVQVSGRRRIAITVAEVLLLGVLVALALITFYWIGSASADVGSGSGSAIPPVPPVPPMPNIDIDPQGYLEQGYFAAKSGDWTAVTALALIGVVWIARKPWALGKIKFFTTDRGGVIMAFGLSVIGGLATAIIATGRFPTDFATYKVIAMTAVTAMGGYVALKRLLWPVAPPQTTQVMPGGDKTTPPATP